MSTTTLPEILKTRLLVGFLGEKLQYGWWPTAFYELSSTMFLEPVFSKTSRLAQYHGVLEAAKRVHDEHLNVGSYHLFRLPEEVEQDLHALIQKPEAEEFILENLRDKASALTALSKLAESNTTSGVGPMAIGNVSDLRSANKVDAIAAAYLAAFRQGAKTYPYLVS